MRNSLEQSNDSNGGTVAITNGLHNHEHDQTNEKIPSTRLSETAQKYMQELLIERGKLENNFPLAVKLIDEGEFFLQNKKTEQKANLFFFNLIYIFI